MNDSAYIASDVIRDRFSKAMSAMYQREVPQYASLLELVAQVNRETLEADPELRTALAAEDALDRVDVERHGAIRVGTADELAMLCRLFAVMGMAPVGYYDLSEAGVPVHSTAFRPVDEDALNRNPFRVFTSLLRLDLIADRALRERAGELLAARDIFTRQTRRLIERYERQGGLDAADADRFVEHALETFRWHPDATVALETYQALHAEHRLIADVVCFRGPHINHLTPRTLDIDEVQRRMPDYGMDPKAVIEGPPRRDCPILLRQTSFKALEETIRFAGDTDGTHSARFGEIEQRGVALTPEGRTRYDRLLAEARRGGDGRGHAERLSETFAEFPDKPDELRRHGLAYFRYRRAEGAAAPRAHDPDVEALIAAGTLIARPIVYEDFLPVSAAGIFQSNLGDDARQGYTGEASQQVLEHALGRPVIDPFALYEAIQARSLARALGTEQPVDATGANA